MYLRANHKNRDEDDSLRSRLFRGLYGETEMKAVLMEMIRSSGAELCAFFSVSEKSVLYVMLESSELSTLIPYISEKVINAFKLFKNSTLNSPGYVEKVFYRDEKSAASRIKTKAAIESYFLVPVIRSSDVAGVVFLGSVRKEAFTKREISFFNSLAGYEEDLHSVVYKVSGEMETAKNLLDALPLGGALITRNGSVVHSNRRFRELLGVGDPGIDSVTEISKLAKYDLSACWDEFKLTGDLLSKKIIEPNLYGESLLKADWTRVTGVSESVDSILILEPADRQSTVKFEEEDSLAVVAHEIRTPLSALKNSLRILLDERTSQTNGNGKSPSGSTTGSIFNTALRTVKRLDLLVDGLVSTSSAKSDNLRMNPVEVKTRPFLESACELFLLPLGKRDIDLSIEISEGFSTMEVDRDRMEQVIQNLISNSLRNVASGGGIKISVGEPAIPEKSVYEFLSWERIFKPSLIEIRIEDSGGGFPEPVIENINGISESRRSRPSPKHGLGLYIASGLVRLHGGILRIGNGKDGGAVCNLYLPADERTRRVMKVFFDIEKRISESSMKRESSVLYLIKKESNRCWLETIGKWDGKPLVDPNPEETSENGLYVWPICEKAAFAVALGERYVLDPEGLIREGREMARLVRGGIKDQVVAGWAVNAGGELGIKEMLERAVENMAAGSLIPV